MSVRAGSATGRKKSTDLCDWTSLARAICFKRFNVVSLYAHSHAARYDHLQPLPSP